MPITPEQEEAMAVYFMGNTTPPIMARPVEFGPAVSFLIVVLSLLIVFALGAIWGGSKMALLWL